MKTISYQGVNYTCPFADLLRPLTPEEHQALADDIRARGVHMPVIVDDENNVIDGQHRLEIANELRLPDVPMKRIDGCSQEEKRGLALALNLNRRHLTPEDLARLRQQRIVRIAEARRDGQSLPQIANQEGVSVAQVQRDLEKAEALPGGKAEPRSGKVTGKDQKSYPARKPKKEPASDTDDPLVLSSEPPVEEPEQGSASPPPEPADPVPTMPAAEPQRESFSRHIHETWKSTFDRYAGVLWDLREVVRRLADTKRSDRHKEPVAELVTRLRDFTDTIEERFLSQAGQNGSAP